MSTAKSERPPSTEIFRCACLCDRKGKLWLCPTHRLAEFVTEIAGWSCDCDFPPEGESGVITCLGCRAKKLLADMGGVK